MAQRPSGHARVPNDFYAEPVECTEALIAVSIGSPADSTIRLSGAVARSLPQHDMALPQPAPIWLTVSAGDFQFVTFSPTRPVIQIW
jgi:hypothetical protein